MRYSMTILRKSNIQSRRTTGDIKGLRLFMRSNLVDISFYIGFILATLIIIGTVVYIVRG